MAEASMVYNVPSSDGISFITIDLAEIYKAELRLGDVATVNQQTAPELLSIYNESWLKLDKSANSLQAHKNKCENLYKRARAEAKMACNDEAVKLKGHAKASADLREAMVDLDETVIAAKDRLDEVSYVLTVLRGKQTAFMNAFQSVKKLTEMRTLPDRKYTNENRPQSFASPTPLNEDPEYAPLPAGFRDNFR